MMISLEDCSMGRCVDMLLHMNAFFCGKIGQTPEKSCCKGFLTWGWEGVPKELCATVGEKSVGVEKICGIENVQLDSADWNWVGGHSGVGKNNSWDKWDIHKCFRAQVSMFAARESQCIVELGDCWIYMVVWGCECECECQHLFVSHVVQWEVPEGSDPTISHTIEFRFQS
jgi:hypothetical protein